MYNTKKQIIMKILFEGTEEQIKNLRLLVANGDNELPTIKENYQTYNLWSVEDVRSKFKCTDDEALEVLEQALTNDATMEQIWFALDYLGEENELERV